MVGVASAATSIVIGYVAAGTRTIRVGAGGIMLPNHSPLVIAEQFGTLESLYPGRIDLGLGRAPGTDFRTLRALRRDPDERRRRSPTTCSSCKRCSGRCSRTRPCKPCRARGSRCRCGFWARASTARSSPRRSDCRTRSRRTSRPTSSTPRSRCIARSFGRRRSSPHRTRWSASTPSSRRPTPKRGGCSPRRSKAFTNLLRGARGRLQPPLDDIASFWTPAEEAQVARMLSCSLVGSPATVREQLAKFVAQHRRRRAHRCRGHLRPSRAPALVRAAGRRRAVVAALSACGLACTPERAALRRSRDPSRFE